MSHVTIRLTGHVACAWIMTKGPDVMWHMFINLVT